MGTSLYNKKAFHSNTLSILTVIVLLSISLETNLVFQLIAFPSEIVRKTSIQNLVQMHKHTIVNSRSNYLNPLGENIHKNTSRILEELINREKVKVELICLSNSMEWWSISDLKKYSIFTNHACIHCIQGATMMEYSHLFRNPTTTSFAHVAYWVNQVEVKKG